MSTVKPAEDLEADPRVKAVFDDIRATRKSDFINNMWLYLAFDPALLERTWAEVKAVMATPSTSRIASVRSRKGLLSSSSRVITVMDAGASSTACS